MILQLIWWLIIALAMLATPFVLVVLCAFIDGKLHPEKFATPSHEPMFADEWEEMAFYDEVLADGLPFFGDR